MSSFKDKIARQVETINNTISNDEERVKVLGCIQELIQEFTMHVVQLTERQNEIDEKLTDVFDILTNIESTIGEDDSDNLFGNCPYCGEEIPLILKDGNFADIECPNCHNTIEMELVCDDDQNSCQGNGCGSCCGGNCSFEDNEEEQKNNCKKKKK